MSSELLEQFEYFLTEATHLGQKYRTVNDLFLCDPAILDSMNKVSPGFFAELYSTYRDAIALNIARICDEAGDRRGNENLSISSMAGRLKELNMLDEELVESCNLLMSINHNALRRLRHKRLAHADVRTALDNEVYEFPTWRAVHDFVVELQRFCYLVANKLEYPTRFSIFLRRSSKHTELFKLYLASAATQNIELSAKEEFRAMSGRVDTPKG